jgi:hypothetical protein
MFSQVPRCSVESLGVRSGWHADLFPGGNSHQHEEVIVFNPQDSKVPLPPG